MNTDFIIDELKKLKKACDLVAERLDANHGYFSLFVVRQRIREAKGNLREAFYELDEEHKVKNFNDLISL